MTYGPTFAMPDVYITTHRPGWLYGGQADYPVMVSYRTLGLLKKAESLPPATVPFWTLDSGGFMELSRKGRWTIDPREYVAKTATYVRKIGRLKWAAIQDHMCEPEVIYGGKVGRDIFPGTRQFIDPGHKMTFEQLVGEHQRRSTASLHELTGLWPQHSDDPCPFRPVLQGWMPRHYEQHLELYGAEGVDLSQFDTVGIGSVCRRSNTKSLAEVARVVNDLPVRPHWFGVKLTGIRKGCIIHARPDEHGVWEFAAAASLDSASWSKDGMHHQGRLPDCTHVSPRTGLPNRCNNCPRKARVWRAHVLDMMACQVGNTEADQLQEVMLF